MSYREYGSDEKELPWNDDSQRLNFVVPSAWNHQENSNHTVTGQARETAAPASPIRRVVNQIFPPSYHGRGRAFNSPTRTSLDEANANRGGNLFIGDQGASQTIFGHCAPALSPSNGASNDLLFSYDNEGATPSVEKMGPQVGPQMGSGPDRRPDPPAASAFWNIRGVMSPDGDSSSEDFVSSNGSEKAVYHGPQHIENLVDLDAPIFDENVRLDDHNNIQAGTTITEARQTIPQGDASGSLTDSESGGRGSILLNFIPIPRLSRSEERCVTPQKNKFSAQNTTSPASPRSPTSPRSQASRSETYHHTFEADQRTLRSPAPPFVVVPSSGSARVTVTTIGLVRSDEDENSLTNQIYIRRGFVFTLAAIMFLGILTMISGLLSTSLLDEETEPPVPYGPSINRPAPVASPTLPPQTFETAEPGTTPRPVFAFPIDSTASPGVFAPIPGKIVREETLPPSTTATPSSFRTRYPFASGLAPGEEAPPTLDPTFPPTEAPAA